MSTTRPILVVTAGSVLQIVLQLAFQTLIARQFGLSNEVAAYEAAIPLPIVVAAILGFPLSSVLIPVVSRVQNTQGPDAAWGTASRFGAMVFSSTFLIAGALFFFADPLIESLYGSFPKAPSLLRLLAWLVPANVVTAFLQALHNWQGRFAISAVAGVVGPGVTLTMIAARGASLAIEDVAVATVAGAIVNVLIQAPPLVSRMRWHSDGGGTRLALRLLVPLLVSGIYLRIDPIVDRALGKSFDESAVACLGYSSRVITASVAVAVGGLSVVTFPRLARAATYGKKALGEEFSGAIRGLVTIVVPLLIAWAVFAPEIIRDLFERGRFTSHDTSRVALFVRCSLGIVLGGSLGEITSRSFFANHDVRTPVLIGVTFFTLAIALKFLLSSQFGPQGILVASSIAFIGSALVQLIVLCRRYGAGLLEGVSGRVLVTAIGAAGACATGGAVTRLELQMTGVVGGLVGLATYIGLMALLIRRRDVTSAELIPAIPPIAEESAPPIDTHQS